MAIPTMEQERKMPSSLRKPIRNLDFRLSGFKCLPLQLAEDLEYDRERAAQSEELLSRIAKWIA